MGSEKESRELWDPDAVAPCLLPPFAGVSASPRPMSPDEAHHLIGKGVVRKLSAAASPLFGLRPKRTLPSDATSGAEVMCYVHQRHASVGSDTPHEAGGAGQGEEVVAMSPTRRLPVFFHDGRLWFVDERLGELRCVKGPLESRPIPVEWWMLKAAKIITRKRTQGAKEHGRGGRPAGFFELTTAADTWSVRAVAGRKRPGKEGAVAAVTKVRGWPE